MPARGRRWDIVDAVKSHRTTQGGLRTPLAIFAIALEIGAVAPARAASPADSAATRPALADSTTEAAPAPLLIPGRPTTGELPKKNPRIGAREQVQVGLELERRGQPAAAISAYRNAVLLDPTVPEAYYRMGKLFLTVNQVKEAVDCFTQEVANHPAHAAAGRELGLGLIALGDNTRAIREFEILTRRNPSDAESWDGLAQALLASQRPREAETAMRRAMRLQPRRAAYVRDYGVALAAQGRLDEARAAYRRAQQMSPRDAGAWLNLANLEAREHRSEAALAAYREAQRRDSTSSLAFQGQVEALHELGRDAEAGALYHTWLQRRPRDVAARLDAVRHFIVGGRPDIALELARGGVRADDRSGDAHLVLGIALGAAGDPRGGLEELRRAEKLFARPADRARATATIAAARRGAPDSLRAFYAEDSIAHPVTVLPAPAPTKRGIDP
jgi:tetratricopeptide (TPR) repeat protein